MNIGDTVQGARDTYTLTGLFEDAPTGLVMRARSRGSQGRELLAAMPMAPADGDALERAQYTFDVWKRLAAAGRAGWLADWSESDQHFLLVEMSSGASISELVVQGGPMPEMDALTFLRQLAGLLQALHTEANAALTPATFAQMRWDGERQQLWAPIWHLLAPRPDFQRQAVDLVQAGVLAHLALSGRPPATLWDVPVVLEALPDASSALSRGAWRSLHRLLHPHPDSRMKTAAELAAEVDLLLRAWLDEPTALSDTAQELLDRAMSGNPGAIWQADAIVDILDRRGLELPITFDWLKDDVEGFVHQRQAVENALHLARAGSNAAAAEQLRQALALLGDNLTLRRWLAALADLDARWFDADRAAEQRLQQAIGALETGDLDVARVVLDALADPPASLAQELAVRTHWRAALGQASNTEATLQALDAALNALATIGDADLRQALDHSLGGLSAWRLRVAHAAAASERAAHVDEARARIRTARLERRWSDGVAILHSALALYPGQTALLEEAMLLGTAALSVQRGQTALEVFALIAGQAPGHQLARLGWRVAQSQLALAADPAGDSSVAQARLAVDQCLALAATDGVALPLIEALRSALATAAASAGRAPVVETVSLLRAELQRLTVLPTPGQPSLLLAMESAIERALAENGTAARTALARFGPPLTKVAPVQAAAQQPATSQPTHERAEPVNEKRAEVLHQPLSPTGKPASTATSEVKPGGTNSKSSPLAEHLLKHLISVHLDQVAAALDDVQRGSLGEGESARLARWAAEARVAVAEHKRGMERVAQLAGAGAASSALAELRKATRAGTSRSCWDPRTEGWTPAAHWQLRLQPPKLEQVVADLGSAEPERWARVLRLPGGLFEGWPDLLKRAASSRQKDLDQHLKRMHAILANAFADPVVALSAFEAWQSYRPNLALCWDAGHSRWAAPGEILADLRLAAAHRSSGSTEDLLAILKADDPRQWETIVNVPAAQRSGWPAEVTSLANRRQTDLLNHRREMEKILAGLAADPVSAGEQMAKWRANNRLTNVWDPRHGRWVPAEALWQEVERAAETAQARKWLDAAIQRRSNPGLGDARDAISRGLAFTKADPALLAELEQVRLATVQPPRGQSSAGAAQLNHAPGSLGALLEAPLRESETLTHLHIRLAGLAQEKTGHADSLRKLASDLEIWVEEERWLANVEQQGRDPRKEPTIKASASRAIELLDRLVSRDELWKPFITRDTPAFANLHRRLQALANLTPSASAPGSTAATQPPSTDRKAESAAPVSEPRRAGSSAAPAKSVPTSPTKPPMPSNSHGPSSAGDAPFQEQLERHMRNTSSLTLLQARLEAMLLVYKDREPELLRLAAEIAALQAVEEELDEVLSLSRTLDARTIQHASEVQARIQSLPIRPKAIKGLEEKALTVQHLGGQRP